MCDKVVKDDLSSLQFVPDWFVNHKPLDVWYDDDHDDDIIKWSEGYKKRKFQKAKIKEELLPMAS